MDLITCGDALWISCGTWLVVWNGLIGALIAALLAAGVAMLVVWFSTKHQTKLAKIERRAQQNTANKELRQQTEGLERQLEEQRGEARLEHRLQAGAELMEAIDGLTSAHLEGVATIQRYVQKSRAAAFKWEMATDDQELSDAIRKAVLSIGLASIELGARMAKNPDEDGAKQQQAMKNILVATMRFNDAMCKLPLKIVTADTMEELGEFQVIPMIVRADATGVGYKGKVLSDDF